VEALEETDRRESEAEWEGAESSSASMRKRRRRSTTHRAMAGEDPEASRRIGLGFDEGEEPDFRKQSKI
jgi:hypothetical protein